MSEISNKPLSDPRLIRRNPLAGYWECRKKIDGAKVAVTPSDRQLKLHRAMLADTDQALEAYDKFMVNVVTSIGHSVINPAQLSMMRIFSNGSLQQGGRLYSAVQNYKKETRKYLYFDDEPTLEIDYSAFHPHLIYHQAGYSELQVSFVSGHLSTRGTGESAKTYHHGFSLGLLSEIVEAIPALEGF